MGPGACISRPRKKGPAKTIRGKNRALCSFLESNSLTDPLDVRNWVHYLVGIKHAIGSLNKDLGFVATLLVKVYLQRRFAITDFNAAGKPQGASGIDIEARTPDGRVANCV